MTNEFGGSAHDFDGQDISTDMSHGWGEHDFHLTRNSTVDRIAHRISTSRPNWRDLFTRLDTETPMHTDPLQVAGLLGEAYVSSVVEKAASQSPEDIKLDPIPDGEVRNNHCFTKVHGNTVVKSTVTGNNEAEYDVFLTAEELPVIGEVRVTRERYKIGKLLGPERIAEKTEPVRDYYGTDDVGYFAAAPKDIITTKPTEVDRKSDVYNARKRRFEDAGGIVVPLPFSLEQINQRAEEYLATHTDHGREAQLRRDYPLLFRGK